MKSYGPQLFFFLLVLAAAITLACGSSSHIPQSVSVTPATAVAQEGQAQFTATAYYNTAPSPVHGVSATWEMCSQAATTNGVSISTSGVAKCSVSGTYQVTAFIPDPTFRGVCGEGVVPCGGVVGTAKLTCP